MDDLLLDDLQIDSNTERQVLLTETRRLCLQELELVDRALKYKQKSEKIPKSKTDASKKLSFESSGIQSHMSTKCAIDDNVKCNKTAVRQECYDEADKVATRATLMVTILSQENSSLRAQLQKSSNCKDQCIYMLQQEISLLKSENHHLRSKAHALEMENKRVLNELQEKCEKCEKFDNYKDIIRKTNSKYSSAKLLSESEKFFSWDQEHRFVQNSLAKDCFSNQKQEEDDLHLINKVYTANKRCAELEDTIRWLYAEVLLAENSNNSLEYSNACNKAEDSEEEQAPSEPEWPSLIGGSSTKEKSAEKSDEHEVIVDRLITQGLPTDTDEDIWILKGYGSSDKLLFQKWNA